MFFFLRGKMLFATALAIFKCFESEILNLDSTDQIIFFLKNIKYSPDILKVNFYCLLI